MQKEVGRRVALAQAGLEATAAVQDDTDESVLSFRVGAYTALWYMLFVDTGDFPEGEGRDAQAEINAELKRLGISTRPKGGVS